MHENGHHLDPGCTCNSAVCRICQLAIPINREDPHETGAQILDHIARAHPTRFEEFANKAAQTMGFNVDGLDAEEYLSFRDSCKPDRFVDLHTGLYL